VRSRRQIPAVSKVVKQITAADLPRPLVVQTIRQELAQARRAKRASGDLVEAVQNALDRLRRSRLQPVINGTGIIVHTNLGRIPLAPEALNALVDAGRTYNNLEFDLNSGTRGGRGQYLERALAALCQTEAVCVVNNCAAALVLIVHNFTRRRSEVIISRGELVQIGGGFRVGEILEAAGATLREVGATNKTTLADYGRAITAKTAMILKVHRSNFFMSGFVASPSTADLAKLARTKKIPIVEDVGSGAVAGSEEFGLREHEPTPIEALRAGVDLVCFSGDKLFGGPQAGIIAGKQRLISALKREPLFRALRCDKLIFAALQATAELHLEKTDNAVPVSNFLRLTVPEMEQRANKIAAQFHDSAVEAKLEPAKSQIGGGALPRSSIESIAIAFRSRKLSADEIARRARNSVPPLIGHVANGAFRIDLRTILPTQDEQVVSTLTQVLEISGKSA
jgi:L-seryl-tRNA(Ser) seleniumtransferase